MGTIGCCLRSAGTTSSSSLLLGSELSQWVIGINHTEYSKNMECNAEADLQVTTTGMMETTTMPDGFVRVRGTEFVLENGQSLCVHGFNAYFLMAVSVDLHSRPKASSLLDEAALTGLTVCRTWAFNDGSAQYQPLQPWPGVYDEKVFCALDFVILEAQRKGIRVILSFCNNWRDYGGKAQYVQWARDAGTCAISCSDDAFFSNPAIKQLYKNHVKAVINRVNTFNGLAYKDDPTIFSWELMNEPQCDSDPSGNILQAWIEEMAAYVKSLDANHLLEVGVEGFYGPSTPNRLCKNPSTYCNHLGTDFVRNHQVAGIDFASFHAYPDGWLGKEASIERQVEFMQDWIQAHRDDCCKLNMPLLLAEFGISDKHDEYTIAKRERLLLATFETVYETRGLGSLIWQLFPLGMNDWSDGYQILLSNDDSVAKIIKDYSWRVAQLT